jgi:hypothetical protein
MLDFRLPVTAKMLEFIICQGYRHIFFEQDGRCSGIFEKRPECLFGFPQPFHLFPELRILRLECLETKAQCDQFL